MTLFGVRPLHCSVKIVAKATKELQKEEEVKELYRKIEPFYSGLVEKYIEGAQEIRELGYVLLSAHAFIESTFEELIMAHLSDYEHAGSFPDRLKVLMKFTPLFEEMFYMGKLKACQEYGYIEKSEKDSLTKGLIWLNSERNKFAHYQSHKLELERQYKNINNRVEALKRILNLLAEMHTQESVASAMSVRKKKIGRIPTLEDMGVIHKK